MSGGLLDRLKGKLTGAEAVEDMCTYLQGLGVNAYVLPKDSSETIPRDKVFGLSTGNPPLGTIKIEGKHIDLIELYPKNTETNRSMGLSLNNIGVGVSASDDETVFKRYILRTNTHLGKELKAELKPIEKGFMKKEIVGYEWKGGKLAKALSADSTLLQMISNAYTKAMIIVDFNEKHQYAVISGTNIRKSKKEVSLNIGNFSLNVLGTAKTVSKIAKGQDVLDIWKNYFPTAEEFAVYDRIAFDIKTLTIPE